jgi:predicted AAA+ superfamily ATPase
MVQRAFWQKQVELAWQHRSVIWLSGVRRAGKTYLCQSLPDVEYFDCELPSVRRALEDPEVFWENISNKRVVLDEIQRLDNPSEILKIAADHYPKIKIIATGSSMLGASAKFADTLSGRKTELWLTPMTSEDMQSFGNTELEHRFLRGGLPPFFTAEKLPEKDYLEWIDAFWAKDIQELFRLEKRYSFQKFTELLLVNSGGIFEATEFAKQCEVSRGTISNYLSVLEATFVAHVIRPFNTHKSTEIISAPKVYGFDTGFICHNRGWLQLRREDMGSLWEHFVLNELHAHLQTRKINYWRDKRGHEIDFVLPTKRNHSPIAIECKWSANDFDPTNLKIFRHHYSEGENYVVAADVKSAYKKRFDNIIIEFISPKELINVSFV